MGKTRDNISSVSDVVIANNTFVGLPAAAFSVVLSGYTSAEIDNIYFLNNIVHNCYRLSGKVPLAFHVEGLTSGSWGSGADIIVDYNLVNAGVEGGTAGGFNGVYYSKYNDWKVASGFQEHIEGTPDPLLDVLYQPTAPSPVVNAGISLSSYYTDDLKHMTRPQGSAWDIGAYEYVPGADTTPPAAPSGLSVN